MQTCDKVQFIHNLVVPPALRRSYWMRLFLAETGRSNHGAPHDPDRDQDANLLIEQPRTS